MPFRPNAVSSPLCLSFVLLSGAAACTGGDGSDADGGGAAGDAAALVPDGGSAAPDGATLAPDGGPSVTADAQSPDGMAAATSGIAADILRTCRTTVACQYGPEPGITLDNCVASLLTYRLNPLTASGLAQPGQQIDRVVRCANTTTDCDSYIKCATLGVPRCTANTSGCEGQLAFTCPYAGVGPHVTDCAAMGLTCEAGQCVVPATATACTPNVFPPRCDGASLVGCVARAGGGGGEFVQACPPGKACSTFGGIALCLPPPVPCVGNSVACDGTSMVRCRDGVGVKEDCASVGLTCGQQSTVHQPECLAKPMECTPPSSSALSNARCEGGDIVACVRGANVRLHCADFALGSCLMTPATTHTCGG